MKTLYLDAEYTCWEGDVPIGMSRQTIQIGVVEVDMKNLLFKRKGLYWVRPHKQSEISKYCTDLTGITTQDIKSYGRPLKEVLSTISEKFSLRKSGVFTWGFETVLIKNIEEVGCLNPFKFIDYSYQHSCFHGFSGGISLTRALKKVGLEFEGTAHNALVDAHNLARLHVKMIEIYRRSNEERTLVL